MTPRNILITGASRGIGKATAIKFLSQGDNVIINHADKSINVKSDIIRKSVDEGRAKIIQSDISDIESVICMKSIIEKEFGDIDALINNAGITDDIKFSDMEYDHWDRVIQTNLYGCFNCCKTFYNQILSSEYGRIINLSSIVGLFGNFGQANYVASKAGINGLTKSIAIEMANSSATANAIAPGFTNTDMLDTIPSDLMQILISKTTVKRVAEPREIADLIFYIASENAQYITGQIIPIDGGLSLLTK
jgi:3-oxoacyl-[acyl-carrier protein] reductase